MTIRRGHEEGKKGGDKDNVRIREYDMDAHGDEERGEKSENENTGDDDTDERHLNTSYIVDI